jgi:hypothetical protein
LSRLLHHPLMIFARWAAVLAAAVLLTTYLSGATSNEEVLAVLPWFCVALFVHIAPPLIAPKTDIFSPPGLTSIQGGLAVGSMIASTSVAGGPAFAALGFISTSQRLDLTRAAMLLLIVAQLSYLFGFYASTGRLFQGMFPKVSERVWDARRLIVVIGASTVLFAVVYAIFQQQMGGSLFDVSQLARGKHIVKGDLTRSWMVRGIAFGFVPVLLLGCAAITARSRRLLVVTVISFLLVALLVTRVGQRGIAPVAGLSLLVAFHFAWRRLSVFLVAAALLCAVVSVNILGEYRQSGEAATTFTDGVSSPIVTIAAHEDDRQRLTVLGVIMHTFPERHDYLMGESYSGLVAAFIPRWIWPEKMSQFRWSDTAIVYNITGLPAPTPLAGVLYANFSWLGVVLGMALFGAFHRGLYCYVEGGARDSGSALCYIAVLGSFAPTMLGISQALQWALPVIILIFVATRPAKSSVRQEAAPDAGGAALTGVTEQRS